MKILSIDIGIKNLAYAILEVTNANTNANANANANTNLDKNSIVTGTQDFKIIKWDVINLCNKFIPCSNTSCSKQANFHKNANFYCKNHTKKTEYSLPLCNIKTLHKQSVANLSTLIEKYDLKIEKPINKAGLIKTLEDYLNTTCFEAIENVNANNVNLIDLGISLKNELNELFNNYDLASIDQIIIENQISPIANRMKSIQGMISQYFIDCNNHNIVFISATNKLKAFLNKDKEKDKEKAVDKDKSLEKEKSADKDKKISYNERKKLSICYTKQLLENKNMLADLTYFVKHSKKDDLADCLLQGIYYLDNKQDSII